MCSSMLVGNFLPRAAELHPDAPDALAVAPSSLGHGIRLRAAQRRAAPVVETSSVSPGRGARCRSTMAAKVARRGSPSMATIRSPVFEPGTRRRPIRLTRARGPPASAAPRIRNPRPLNRAAGSVRWRRCSASGDAEVAARVLTIACRAPRASRSPPALTASSRSKHDVALADDRRAVDAARSHRPDAGPRARRASPAARRRRLGRSSVMPVTQNMPHSTQDREEDVECGAGQQHHDALPGRLAGEGARQVRGGNGTFALIEHLDVAAQRNRGEDVLGAIGTGHAACSSGLPKPTEKRSTLKPSRRATQKWPNSCTVTSRLTATTNHSSVPDAHSCASALRRCTLLSCRAIRSRARTRALQHRRPERPRDHRSRPPCLSAPRLQ